MDFSPSILPTYLPTSLFTPSRNHAVAQGGRTEKCFFFSYHVFLFSHLLIPPSYIILFACTLFPPYFYPLLLLFKAPQFFFFSLYSFENFSVEDLSWSLLAKSEQGNGWKAESYS